MKLGYDHQHSALSSRLVTDVIESGMVAGIEAAKAAGSMAMASHPNVQADSLGNVATRVVHSLVACYPYMTEGRTADDALQAERMAAVEKYKRMMDALKKE